MEELELKGRLSDYIREICHYSQKQVFATSYYQKNYFQMQIDKLMDEMLHMYMENNKKAELADITGQQLSKSEERSNL